MATWLPRRRPSRAPSHPFQCPPEAGRIEDGDPLDGVQCEEIGVGTHDIVCPPGDRAFERNLLSPGSRLRWRAVRLSVRAKAPRRRTCVSRTTRGPDSADGLAYNSRSSGLGNIGLGSCTLDEGVEFLIGESRQRAVDFLETGPCAITRLEALEVTQVRRPRSGQRPAQTLFLIVLDPQRVSG